MENTKNNTKKVQFIIKEKTKNKETISISDIAHESNLSISEVESIINDQHIDLDVINTKTKYYIDTYITPISIYLNDCVSKIHDVRISELAESLNISHAKVFSILKDMEIDILSFNKKIKETYHENILKQIKIIQKTYSIDELTIKKLHEQVNYKYSLFTFGIFLQNNNIILSRKASFQDTVNSLKPFIKNKIKNDHEIRLVDVAKELNVTTQRASIILKQMNLDIKEINRKAKDDYHNDILKKIADLKNKKVLDNFSPQKLYVFLNYKFPFFNFNELLKEKGIRLKFNIEYIDLFKTFENKGIKTKLFTVRELYDLSDLQEQMQFTSFRVKVYATGLPYKKKAVNK